jgi:alpha-galactosidase
VTNKELLNINQNAEESHPVKDLPAGFRNVRVWKASVEAYANPPCVIGLFNLGDAQTNLHFKWSQLGIKGQRVVARDIFNGSESSEADEVSVTLAPHGSTAYSVSQSFKSPHPR